MTAWTANKYIDCGFNRFCSMLMTIRMRPSRSTDTPHSAAETRNMDAVLLLTAAFDSCSAVSDLVLGVLYSHILPSRSVKESK